MLDDFSVGVVRIDHPPVGTAGSGKIMRRILRNLASGQTTDLGDLTTLAEPAVVDELIATLAGGGR